MFRPACISLQSAAHLVGFPDEVHRAAVERQLASGVPVTEIGDKLVVAVHHLERVTGPLTDERLRAAEAAASSSPADACATPEPRQVAPARRTSSRTARERGKGGAEPRGPVVGKPAVPNVKAPEKATKLAVQDASSDDAAQERAVAHEEERHARDRSMAKISNTAYLSEVTSGVKRGLQGLVGRGEWLTEVLGPAHELSARMVAAVAPPARSQAEFGLMYRQFELAAARGCARQAVHHQVRGGVACWS